MAITGAEGAADAALLLRRIERASIETWPALETVADGSWIARFAQGLTGRANAVHVLDPADTGRLEDRLDWMQTQYRARGLVPAVRVTPLTPPALVAALNRRGFRTEGRSLVLAGKLPPASDASEMRIEVAPTVSQDWIAAAAGAGSRTSDAPDVLRAMMARYECPAAFLLARDDSGTPAALLVASVSHKLLTVHNVATAPALRRRGVASTLMGEAVTWGRAQGAERLFIAVAEDNHPARRLYEGLGLATLYPYHYRRPAEPDGPA